MDQFTENATPLGLYDPQFEHDACGIGAVVDIKGRKSHQTVSDALSIVERLEHRAGKDAEGKTGDGVGIMLQISHKFFSKVADELNISLGNEREYGVGMFFFPQNEHLRAQAMKLFELVTRKEGLEFLAWREVPVNPDAVGHIFAAKGRPQDNPLILHIPSADWLERYCVDIPDTAYALAERFWPGPLTMVLRRKRVVPDVVTAGLDTVGMRCPAHPVCRAILTAADVPVAAPSGNTSGRPSPTTAAGMLEDMDGKIDGIVDGGPCAVGVESTIVDLTVMPPRLLRPGGVTLEQLRDALGEVVVDPAVTRLMGAGEQPRAPGMKYRHYAPKAPVTVVQGAPAAAARYIQAHMAPGDGVICFDEYAGLFAGHPLEQLGPSTDVPEQARRVFEALRWFDGTGVSHIWAQCPAAAGIGLAVANRLNKAAGFHIVRAE